MMSTAKVQPANVSIRDSDSLFGRVSLEDLAEWEHAQELEKIRKWKLEQIETLSMIIFSMINRNPIIL
jgi:hypothetical protein